MDSNTKLVVVNVVVKVVGLESVVVVAAGRLRTKQ
jgi:hypothetical protein